MIILCLYNKVYTNFCVLNVPEDNAECKFFTVTSIDSLILYGYKYYLQVYLYKTPVLIKLQTSKLQII